MAVKASATITLTQYRDTQSVTRYYKLQPAGSSAPLKPETKPPSSDWTDSEPACDISKELYFCDLTIFSNGEGEYSKVSKSTSYEAAKEAYNKAQSAKDSIDNLEIGGRNLFLGTKDFSGSKWKGNTYNYYNDGDIRYTKIYSAPTSSWVQYICQYLPLDADTEYVMSALVRKNTDEDVTICWRFDLTEVSNNYATVTSKEWTRVVFPFRKRINAAESESVVFYVPYNSVCVSTETAIDVAYIKFEKGNKATDWTPAPEDVDANIDSSISEVQNAVDEVGDIANNKVDISDYDADKEALDNTINDIHTTTDNLSKEISNELVAKGYAKIIPEEPSIELGRSASDWKVKITNESVDLQKAGSSGAKLSPNPERANETLFRADTVRLSNVYFRSADNQGKLGIVAQSNGHISLKEI